MTDGGDAAEKPLLIVASEVDTASMNIKKHFLDIVDAHRTEIKLWDNTVLKGRIAAGEFFLATMRDEHVRHENFDHEASQAIGTDFSAVVVFSRHRSASGKKSLTVHPPGNYGVAEYGGQEGTLVPSAPRYMTGAFLSLHETGKEMVGDEYDITFEVTHHGPYVETPTFFIEIGSDEKAWRDKRAARVIAETVASFAPTKDNKVAVGIGGGHYAPRFSELALRKEISFGHMIPSYALEDSTPEEIAGMVETALSKTPGANGVYVHKKGLRGEARRKVREALQILGINPLRSSEIPDRSIPDDSDISAAGKY